MNKKQTGYNTPKAVHDTRELLLWMIPLIDKIHSCSASVTTPFLISTH